MVSKAPAPIRLSKEELGRQAIDALRGYTYQLYQSLLTWLRLKDDELLLLEVAEDYAVLAEGSINATQVKATSGTVTLRTTSAVEAIKSFWTLQGNNQDKAVHVTYLTTSGIGREKQMAFPEGKPGLEYWRTAARDGSDVEPMRAALSTLELPKV